MVCCVWYSFLDADVDETVTNLQNLLNSSSAKLTKVSVVPHSHLSCLADAVESRRLGDKPFNRHRIPPILHGQEFDAVVSAQLSVSEVRSFQHLELHSTILDREDFHLVVFTIVPDATDTKLLSAL